MRLAIPTSLAVVAVAIAAVTGAECAAQAASRSSRQVRAEAGPGAGDATGTAESRRLAGRLTPLELAGERVVYAYSGLTPPSRLLAAIATGEAAGVILFTPNIATRSQVRAAIALMQHAARNSPTHRQLLIFTDQEGGEVRRLSGAPALSEKQIGASAQPRTRAAQAGSSAAENLAGVGVNVNLAPVLDVYRSPGNFIDRYQRSYSQNPQAVAQLASAFVTAQQAKDVAATAKHFPGLGAATHAQDTDLGPVTLKGSRSAIRDIDEAPYPAVIAAGVKLVMTSWAIYPALDASRPAGFSRSIIQGELRGRLGFDGVTITDSIDAGAVHRYGTVGHRSVLAAMAGQDLILACTTSAAGNSPSYGLDAVHAIAAAISSQKIGLQAAENSAARVLALRSRP